MTPYLWLIPFFPLVSSIIIRFFGKRILPRAIVHFLSCTSVGLSFLIALKAFFELRVLPDASRIIVNDLYTWFQIGDFRVGASFLFDPLSAVMVLVITGVGFLIHLYSTGYMGHEKDYERYFAYLNLFTAMMLILVLGDGLLTMFVGWEGVGLCSYLLIGFWFGDNANADAGKKAFVVNRIGDFGFIVGLMLLFWAMGMATDVWSVSYADLKDHAEIFTSVFIFGVPVATLATLMLFLGAAGKSAQIPLYVWLPDAMAGPTPVSALIHAATMVTAGVYMIARLSFLFDLAPLTLNVVATVGGLTALFAATMALVQTDIKKVLAYSTVSQLGYMFLACGVGAYAAAIFHLMTHAFFKALLFLGSGSVIHAMSNEQDMRKMGGLKNFLPVTWMTFLIGTLAITGFPFLTAGFFSKDEILWQAWDGPHGSPIFWGMGVVAAGMTAFYMFRLFFMTFHGRGRYSDEVRKHVHESPMSMLLPLIVLAFLSIVGGWLWFPGFIPLTHIFPDWLASAGAVVVHSHEGANHILEMALAATSVVVAFGGFFMAYRIYIRNPDRAVARAQKWPGMYRILLNKYYVDEAYDYVFVRGTKRLSAILYWFDSRIVDGIVNGTAKALHVLVFFDGMFDRIFVDGLVNLTGSIIAGMGQKIRQLQTGAIQTYLGAMAAAIVVISMAWMSVLT